jgi:hypothetical protein
MRRRVMLLASLALSSFGCAEQLQLLDRGPTAGVSPCSFWPPPPSSATWLVPEQGHGESPSSVARDLETGLRGSGYSEQRWYPIGVAGSHGFAVTTRLEQLEEAVGEASRARWSALYADAASLKWLAQARTPSLPRPGRYRVVLVSYTDLPIGRTSSAPIWNEETVMDWPNASPSSSPRVAEVLARPTVGYRLGIYEYEYVWDEAEARGRLLPADELAASTEPPPPAALLRALGLAPDRRTSP